MDQKPSKKILPLEDNISEGYPDLKEFKESTPPPGQELYADKKRKVIHYRTIFLTFGIIFMSLAAYIFTKSPIWIMSGVKPIICLFTFLLGIGAFTIAIALRYEKEAVRSIYHKALQQLYHAYVERKGSIDQDHEMSFSETFKRKMALKNPFLAAKAKMKGAEIESIDLMDRIVKAPNLNLAMKEKLFNQVLEELQLKLEHILHDYRSSP